MVRFLIFLFKIVVYVLFHQQVDGHVADGWYGKFEHNVVAECHDAAVPLQAGTLAYEEIHSSLFKAFYVLGQKVVAYNAPHLHFWTLTKIVSHRIDARIEYRTEVNVGMVCKEVVKYALVVHLVLFVEDDVM